MYRPSKTASSGIPIHLLSKEFVGEYVDYEIDHYTYHYFSDDLSSINAGDTLIFNERRLAIEGNILLEDGDELLLEDGVPPSSGSYSGTTSGLGKVLGDAGVILQSSSGPTDIMLTEAQSRVVMGSYLKDETDFGEDNILLEDNGRIEIENSVLEVEELSLKSEDNNANLILSQHKESNDIKNLYFYENNILNENKINKSGVNFDAIISKDTSSIALKMSSSDFNVSFSESFNKIDQNQIFEIKNERINFFNREKLVENKIYSLDFLKMIDNDISFEEVLKHFAEDSYFDIFSITINKSLLDTEQKIKDTYNITEDELNNSTISISSSIDNNYSYIIETRVV